MGLRRVNYARNGDVHLAYEVRGAGEHDILFVLPWFSNLDLLDSHPLTKHWIDRFAEVARLVLFDRRGSGLSDRTCGHATLEEGVDDLFAVLDAADVEKVTLIGMNESGSLAAFAAATRPDRVVRLVLYGSYATTVWQPDYPWAPRPEERQQEVDLLVRFWGTPEAAFGVNPGLETDEAFVDWATRWMRGSVSKDALPRAYEILSKSDVRHVLGSISVPTLVLHRTGDAVVPIGNAHYLAEHIPAARLVELDGDDHLPFFGDAEAIAAEVEEFVTGVRPAREHDRILATILFCDVVGSSRLASEMGDRRWRGLLERFEAAARSEVARAGGRLVKTLGDGFLATFDGPARAIRCACKLSAAASGMGLTLRNGIHTGEVEVHPDDVSGIAVHIAARVADLAGGGEVLVSSAVPPLVAGAGITFEDRGVHPLRGIEGEWRVLSVSI